MLTTEKEQEKRWAEHFCEELNRPSPVETAIIPEATVDLDINTVPPKQR
jgi:hypothetical protein